MPASAQTVRWPGAFTASNEERRAAEPRARTAFSCPTNPALAPWTAVSSQANPAPRTAFSTATSQKPGRRSLLSSEHCRRSSPRRRSPPRSPPAPPRRAPPGWHLDSTAAPTNLPLQQHDSGEAHIVVSATNLGDGVVNATPEHPLTFTHVLPEGVTAVGLDERGGRGDLAGRCLLSRVPRGTGVHPHLPLRGESSPVRIDLHADQRQGEPAPAALHAAEEHDHPQRRRWPLRIAVKDAQRDGHGNPVRRAVLPADPGKRGRLVCNIAPGSHPFQLTTTLDFDQVLSTDTQHADPNPYPAVPAFPRNLRSTLSPGLAGDVAGLPRCSEVDFLAEPEGRPGLVPANDGDRRRDRRRQRPRRLGSPRCPEGARLQPRTGAGRTGAVWFLSPWEKCRSCSRTSIPAGGWDGVQVSVQNISQAAQVPSSAVTFWGVPGDPRHYGLSRLAVAPMANHRALPPKTPRPRRS